MASLLFGVTVTDPATFTGIAIPASRFTSDFAQPDGSLPLRLEVERRRFNGA